MSTMLISYDLQKPGKNYDALISHIKSYGTWCHLLDSTWAIVTLKSVTAVLDDCLTHVDGNDKLHVVDVTGKGAAWYGLDQDVTNWLKQHN